MDGACLKNRVAAGFHEFLSETDRRSGIVLDIPHQNFALLTEVLTRETTRFQVLVLGSECRIYGTEFLEYLPALVCNRLHPSGGLLSLANFPFAHQCVEEFNGVLTISLVQVPFKRFTL